MIHSRFSPIVGADLSVLTQCIRKGLPVPRTGFPYHTRLGVARRLCFVADEACGVYGRETPCGSPAAGPWRIGSLLMVVLVLALTLNACSQPQPSQTQNIVSAVTYHAARSVSRATASTKVLPVRLSIPAIGVDAPIEAVGVTTAGDLAIPAQNPWQDVGWYSSGPLPGELGSSVIDGHLDRPGGYPAVFWRLRDLNVGNEVIVIDTQGKMLHFRVTAIEYYQPGYAPIEQIFANQGGRYLNLITCAGDWIPSQHQTTLRLVVYTTLE